MGQFHEVLSHWREQRESFRTNLKAVEEGVYTLRESHGVYWVDATDDWGAKLKRDIQKLDKLIAVYEARDGRGESLSPPAWQRRA